MKKLVHQYITTGTQLSEHQFNQLSNNQVKSYLNLRVRRKGMASYELLKLNELDRGRTDKYISKLDPVNIADLIEGAEDAEQIIKLLGPNRVDDYVNGFGLRRVLMLSPDPEKTINLLGDQAKELFSRLVKYGIDDRDLKNIFYGTKAPQKIVDLLSYQAISYLVVLDMMDISQLLKVSKVPKELLSVISLHNKKIKSLKIGDLVSELSKGLDSFFISDEILDAVFNNPNMTYKMDNEDVYSVKTYSKRSPNEVIELLLTNKKLMSNLQPSGIKALIISATDREGAKDALRKYGYSEEMMEI